MIQKLTDEIATLKNSPQYFINTINVLPNPDEILRKAGKTLDAYKEVLDYSRVYSVNRSRNSIIHALENTVSGNNKIHVDFINKNLRNIGISKLINDIYKAIPWGWQPIELIWKTVNSMWEIIRIDAKPHTWFLFDNDQELCKYEKDGFNFSKVPEYQFICPQFEHEYSNPYGKALLGKVFWNVIFAKNIMKFGLDYVERLVIPLIKVEYPNNLSDDEISNFVENLLSLVRGGVVAIPEGSKLELLQSSSDSSNAAFKIFINMLHDDIAITFLGGNLQTETRSGSHAAAKSQNDVREDIRDQDADFIAQNINKIIKLLIDYNFGEQSEYPLFEFIWQDEVKLDLASYTKTMTEVGVEFTPDFYENRHKLMPNEYKIKESNTQSNQVSNFSESDFQFTSKSSREILDSAVSRLSSKDLEYQSRQMLDPIIKMIKEGSSYSECLNNLAEIFPKMNSGALQEMINTSCILSEAIGIESQKGDLENSLAQK